MTLLDDPTMTYSATEQFVQGQNIIPHAIEQQVAGMQPGETKTFPLSARKVLAPTMQPRLKRSRQPIYPSMPEKGIL